MRRLVVVEVFFLRLRLPLLRGEDRRLPVVLRLFFLINDGREDWEREEMELAPDAPTSGDDGFEDCDASEPPPPCNGVVEDILDRALALREAGAVVAEAVDGMVVAAAAVVAKRTPPGVFCCAAAFACNRGDE